MVAEQCSAGISRKGWMTVHAVAIWDPVFLMLGVVQIGAIGAILYYANSYKNLVCPTHFSEAARREGKTVSQTAD